MANGFGFSGGLARGLQRSFPDVGGIMREERVREEEKRKQQQEKEEKRLLDTARLKAQENMDAADKIIETAKSGLQMEQLDQKELADLKKMYISFVQNANLDRAMLGAGPVPGHNTDGSTFDMAVQNIETISQKQQREQEAAIAKKRALRPEEAATTAATTTAREKAQLEVATGEGLDKPFATPRVAVRTDPATGQVERRTVTSMRELRALRDEGFQFMSLPSAQVSEQTADQLFGSGAAEESRLMQLEGAATLGAAGAIMNDVNELFGENVGAVRLAIGRGVGKVAGQVPLIGDVAEEFLTENIAGASAQKLASFRSKQMAFVARLVPLYSREAGRRVTDRELDIAGRGSQQYDSFATRSSIVGAIAATVTLTFADMFKQEIINDPTTSFSVNLTADPATEPELWKQNVELMRNELSKLGFDDETSAEIISDLSLIQNQLGIVQRRLISRAGSTPMMEMQLQ